MKTNTQKGFSLLEVLISITVVSFGLVGLAKLQAELARETADVRDRMLALNLLKQKTADLKRFEALVSTTGLNAYQDISNNTGGSLSAGSYNGFSLSWCVDTDNCQGSTYDGEYYYGADNTAATNTDPGSTLYPNFKKVKLNVAWTNAKGETKILSRETIVIPKLKDDSGIVANASTSLAYSIDVTEDTNTEQEETDSITTDTQETQTKDVNKSVTQTEEESIDLPDGTSDNGDGTSSLSVNGNTLTFSNTTGKLIEINGSKGTYYSISGSISLSGPPAPKTKNVDSLTMSSATIDCIYPYTAGSGFYMCYFENSFSGSVTLSGLGTDVACPSSSYSYTNLSSDIEAQDFAIHKTSCN